MGFWWGSMFYNGNIMRLNGIFIEDLHPKWSKPPKLWMNRIAATTGSNPNISRKFTPSTTWPIKSINHGWNDEGFNHLSGWIHVHAVVGAQRQTSSPTEGALHSGAACGAAVGCISYHLSRMTHHASCIRYYISYNRGAHRFPRDPHESKWYP